MAVEHADDASGVGGKIWIVGDHNNSVAGGVDVS